MKHTISHRLLVATTWLILSGSLSTQAVLAGEEIQLAAAIGAGSSATSPTSGGAATGAEAAATGSTATAGAGSAAASAAAMGTTTMVTIGVLAAGAIAAIASGGSSSTSQH